MHEYLRENDNSGELYCHLQQIAIRAWRMKVQLARTSL